MNKKKVIKVGVAVFGVIILYVCYALYDSNVKSGRKRIAWDKGCEAVRNRLKSPASAKFPEYKDEFIKVREILEHNGYSYMYCISSDVDAANVFGALLRKSFYVAVFYTVDGKWEILNNTMNIDGEDVNVIK